MILRNNTTGTRSYIPKIESILRNSIKMRRIKFSTSRFHFLKKFAHSESKIVRNSLDPDSGMMITKFQKRKG